MKHLEPLPPLLPNTPQSAPSAPTRKRPAWRLVLLGAALVFGLGAGLSAFWSEHSRDHLSSAEQARLQAEFAAASPLRLTPVTLGEQSAALDSMQLPAPERAELARELAVHTGDRRTTLAWLELWDFASQDGDVVRVSSSGYERQVPILNAPTRLAIPVVDGVPVTVTGVYDGGGGITLGVRSGAMPMSLPVLAPGAALVVPVTF